MRVRAAFIAGLAMLAVAAPAQADTWEVQGNQDGGTCDTGKHVCQSLRAAIAFSKDTPDKDLIKVPGGEPVLLNQGELVIDSDMDINGAGARTTILDAGRKARVFRITAAAKEVQIRHLPARNGSVGSNGGGILNEGSN